MLEDVRLAVNGRRPVHFLGRMGAICHTERNSRKNPGDRGEIMMEKYLPEPKD
jgi:hypothetical protein